MRIALLVSAFFHLILLWSRAVETQLSWKTTVSPIDVVADRENRGTVVVRSAKARWLRSARHRLRNLPSINQNQVADLGNSLPEYPRIAIESGWEGALSLRLLLSSDGFVKEVFLEETSGYPILDESALTAAKTWKLSQYAGKEITVPIHFELD